MTIKSNLIKMGSTSRILNLLMLTIVSVTPLWFITFFGINIGPADILILPIAIIIAYKSDRLPLAGTWLSAGGILMFLFFISISTIINYNHVEFTNYLQYLFIFLVFFPTVLYFAVRDHWRLRALTVLSIVTGIVILWALFTYLTSNANIGRIALEYGNHNQIYWVIGTGSLLNLGLALSRNFRIYIRVLSFAIALIGIVMTSLSIAQSAILLVWIGIWIMLLALVIHSQNAKLQSLFILGTLIIGVVAAALIVLYWEYIYRSGSLNVRFTQYRAAFWMGLTEQPFGAGIGSSDQLLTTIPGDYPRSVHNFTLSYWLEVGILALLGYLMFIVDLLRNSVFGILHPDNYRPIELSLFAIVIGSISIMLFQPELVRRFWYTIFALSYATTVSQTNQQ